MTLSRPAISVSQSDTAGALLSDLSDILCQLTCPACGHHVAVPFYDGGHQPLTTLAWPESEEQAQTMTRLPLAFHRCVDCGHVYNSKFDYADVPYSDKPNLMFNRGQLWKDHLTLVRDKILACLPENPVVIEIGAGDGHLLRALAEVRPDGRYIGFDPSGTVDTAGGLIESRDFLFEADKHIAEYKPDVIISRHVLEHLMNPLGFVQSLAFAASWQSQTISLFIEVPCIDRVFSTERTADFFYEHNSHFTTESLTRLLLRCADEVDLVSRGYDDEVVYGLARLGVRRDRVHYAERALSFFQNTQQSQATISRQMADLVANGRSVAIWGGTGKAAAFINRYVLDAVRFPVVVDSDQDKAGTFVPGMGQPIQFSNVLCEQPVQVIVVATQWRAKDIFLEITAKGITYEDILLEHQGRLISYFSDEHPYGLTEAEKLALPTPPRQPVGS